MSQDFEEYYGQKPQPGIETAQDVLVLTSDGKGLRGKSRSVAEGIRRSATLNKLSEKEREKADKCADYLSKYADYLQYDRYLAVGYPIATGVIEGACRHLICDRMDITGARWRLDRAEAVLKVRALRTSGDA